MPPIAFKYITGDIAEEIAAKEEFKAIIEVKVVTVTQWWPNKWWENVIDTGTMGPTNNVWRAWTNEHCLNFIEIPLGSYGGDQKVTRSVYDDDLNCANFWDEVTSRNCDWKHVWREPDPMKVLAESSDGAKRGKALARLHEPIQNGGTREQHEMYLKILTTAATVDREPLCRLGAVRALATYKDPGAVKALEDVYLQLTGGEEVHP